MKLLALNKRWAIYDPSGVSKKYDTFLALRDLLQVKTYNQLILFLEQYTCNSLFVTDSDTNYNTIFNCEYENSCNKKKEINLQGNLNDAISHHIDLDLLDELVLEDLKGRKVYQLFLPELIDFQKTVRSFLKYAAVGLGATATEEMFLELETSLFFDEKWLSDFFGDKASEFKTIGFPQEYIGVQHDGLLDDYAFDNCGIFSYTREEMYQQKQQVASYNTTTTCIRTDEFSFPLDGVIYSYEEWCSEDDYRSDNYYVTVSFPQNISLDQAKMLLAGRAVEALLELLDSVCYEQKQFSVPYSFYDDSHEHTFFPNKGFIRKGTFAPKWWVDELLEQAISLIFDGKVALCPMCGSPVLIKDYRGNKAKTMCSNSCKTKASNNRKEIVFRYAALKKPIEEAIQSVGKEYAQSVRKWYKEAERVY